MKTGEDVMNSILEMLLTGLIDPLIWMKSMSTWGGNKDKKVRWRAYLGYYLLLVGKDLLTKKYDSNLLKILVSVILAAYIFGATWKLTIQLVASALVGKLVSFILCGCPLVCVGNR